MLIQSILASNPTRLSPIKIVVILPPIDIWYSRTFLSSLTLDFGIMTVTSSSVPAYGILYSARRNESVHTKTSFLLSG